MPDSTISTFIDAAELLCRERPESFPYERHLTLAQHMWWAFEPREQVYRDLTLLASAQIFRSCESLNRDGDAQAASYYSRNYLAPSKFADFVLNRHSIEDFHWFINYHSDGQIRAVHIANYLLSARNTEGGKHLVSLNKAYFFVRAKADAYLNTSRRTLLSDWQLYRRTVPILLWWFNKRRPRPRHFVLPDPSADDFLSRMDRLVGDVTLMREFFSVCMSYHLALKPIFSNGTVGFPGVDRMPKFLEKFNVLPPPLSKHDLNKMLRYRSPNN